MNNNSINKITITLLIVASPIVFLYAQSKDEQMVAKAVEELRLVMMQPDATVLERLASNDLEYVHSSGAVRNKKGFIDEFVQRQTHVSNVVFSNQTIKVSGNTAIVRHRMVADSHKAGYPPVIDIIIMMVWKKEKNEWKLLARQAAKIPQ